MPGHVKKSTGPDPDPLPWLAVSEELKKKLLSKPYDAKKSCWVPDKATHGYSEGLIESTDGEKVTVKILETGEVNIIILSYFSPPFMCKFRYLPSCGIVNFFYFIFMLYL